MKEMNQNHFSHSEKSDMLVSKNHIKVTISSRNYFFSFLQKMPCNSSTYSVEEAEQIVSSFFYFDVVSGSVLLIFAFVYLYYIIKEYKNSAEKEDYSALPQIVFFIALLWKGVSLILTSIFRKYNSSNWANFSVILTGLAGYISALAYAVIFFTWTALCANYLGHDFAGFYKASRSGLLTIIIIVFIMLILALVMMFLGSSEQKVIYHYIEASCASFRDIIIAICFFMYFRKVLALSEAPYCDRNKPETKVFFMCGFLITVLVLRATSILVYAFFWSDWGNLAGKCREFNGYGYFSDYVLEQILLEFLPLFYIGVTRINLIIDTPYSSLDVNEADYSYPN